MSADSLREELSSAMLFIAILKFIFILLDEPNCRGMLLDECTQRFLGVCGEAPPPLNPTALETKARTRL